MTTQNPQFEGVELSDGSDPSLQTDASQAKATLKPTNAGRADYFNAFVLPVHRENRWFFGFLVSCLVNVFMALALWQLIPLKEKYPVAFEVETATGRVEMSDKRFVKFEAGETNVAYFLRLWVDRIFLINGYTLSKENGVAAAIAWTRGAAVNELDELILVKEKIAERIAKTPGLTRDVVHRSLNFGADGKTVFIRFYLIEKMNGVEVSRTARLLTVEYIFVAARTDDERGKNPIGLAVTHFTEVTETGDK